MINILLTGGLGFIGSNTCFQLLNLLPNEYQIIVLDNLNNSKLSVLDELKQLTDISKIIFIKGDILNDSDVNKAFEYSIDCVIHFAAHKSVSQSIQNPLDYYENNISGLVSLLKKCHQKKVYKFIFSSSATVYGTSVSPLTETSNIGIGISNPYGQTKFMGEQILKDWCLAYPQFSVICLRYFNPVGAHPSGLLGEDPNDIPNNLMPYVIKVAAKNNLHTSLDEVYNYLSIFGDDYQTPDGTAQRDFIHVVDLARAHVSAYQYFVHFQDNYEVFNIGTGKPTSVLELVSTFQKINKVKIPYQIKSRRAGDMDITYCQCEKSKKNLGWEAELNIENICQDSYNYIKRKYT